MRMWSQTCQSLKAAQTCRIAKVSVSPTDEISYSITVNQCGSPCIGSVVTFLPQNIRALFLSEEMCSVRKVDHYWKHSISFNDAGTAENIEHTKIGCDSDDDRDRAFNNL